MIKHLYIKIEGDLEKTDFNYYCQTGAVKFDISAVYVNGNSKDVELDAEGTPDNLYSYIEFLKTGPLKPYINTFEYAEQDVQNIKGFVSKRIHRDEKPSLFDRIKKLGRRRN